MQFIVDNARFYTHIITQYCPEPFISGVIENKIKKALQFCACSNLRLLNFNNPEYRPLQACFDVEMPSCMITDLFMYRDPTGTYKYFEGRKIQWNPAKADTVGTKNFVHYREVSLAQG